MLHCIVIDDEPLAVQLLQNHIGNIPYLKLIGTYNDPVEALASITVTPVDLVFLDIQMPRLNGIQVMQVLQNSTMVIITSAYQQYALDGFEYNVVDFLLKPVSFERFYRAVEKAYKLKFPAPALTQPSYSLPGTGGYLFVKVETKMIRIELDDILYIKGLKNYVSIHTITQVIMTLQTMKQLEETLPLNRFIRIHKSYIVAMDKINSIERQEVHISEHVIPIGNTYLPNFNKMLEARKA